MNLPEQMYADLKGILPDLQAAVEKGVSYGGDLFHRFIWFDIAMHSLELIVWLSSLILLPVAFKRGYKFWKRLDEKAGPYDDGHDVVAILGLAVIGLLSFISILGAFGSIKTIAKDIFIPEIRVIEVVSDLLPSPSDHD